MHDTESGTGGPAKTEFRSPRQNNANSNKPNEQKALRGTQILSEDCLSVFAGPPVPDARHVIKKNPYDQPQIFDRTELGLVGYRTLLGVRKVRASQAAQGVTPLHREVRTSGTERMSRAWILKSGTGDLRGAAGVKTAKLCVKQDQIGRRLSVAARASGLIARGGKQFLLEMNDSPRQNPAYR